MMILVLLLSALASPIPKWWDHSRIDWIDYHPPDTPGILVARGTNPQQHQAPNKVLHSTTPLRAPAIPKPKRQANTNWWNPKSWTRSEWFKKWSQGTNNNQKSKVNAQVRDGTRMSWKQKLFKDKRINEMFKGKRIQEMLNGKGIKGMFKGKRIQEIFNGKGIKDIFNGKGLGDFFKKLKLG
jgi:hypothetical protein